MFDAEIYRRRFIIFAGATGVTGLAGCTTAPPTSDGQGGSDESTPTSTETAAVVEDEHHEEEMPHDEGDEHHEEETHQEADEHHADEAGEEHEAEGHEAGLAGPVDSAGVKMVSTDRGNHFEPHVVWVTEGGTVRWTNASGFHSTTSYSPENDRPQLTPDGVESWDSGVITESGETFEHTFETEGVYHYYCLPHEFTGMIGSVIVGRPDPAEQPALADPPESLPESVRRTIELRNSMVKRELSDSS